MIRFGGQGALRRLGSWVALAGAAVSNLPLPTSFDTLRWHLGYIAEGTKLVTATDWASGKVRYFDNSTGHDTNGDGLDPWKFAIVAADNATFTLSTLTLTCTGKFSSYDHDQAVADGTAVISITGGTGVTTGVYPIASKTSNDAIVLGSAIAAGNVVATDDLTASPGPWKSISKVNTEISGHTTGTLWVRLKRGEVWRGTTGIANSSNRANLRIGDYGTHERPPQLTAFESEVTVTWTADAGAYYRTVSTAVALVRDTNSVATHGQYRRVASVAACQANEATWFWDSGANRLYVHLYDDHGPGRGHGIEWVFANTADGIHTGTPDNVIVENIRVDGFGANDNSTGASGITSAPTGTNRQLILNCESWHNGDHGIKQVTSGSGGRYWVIGCSSGFHKLDKDPYVSYASDGQQEFMFAWCKSFGILEDGATGVWAGGVGCGTSLGFYAHTSGGANKIAFGCFWECEVGGGQFDTGFISAADCPAISGDLANARVFVIGCKYEPRSEKTTLDETLANGTTADLNIPQFLGGDDVCYFNNDVRCYRHGPDVNVSGQTANMLTAFDGHWWNNDIRFTFTEPHGFASGSDVWFGIVDSVSGATALGAFCYNNRITLEANALVYLGIDLRKMVSPSANTYNHTIPRFWNNIIEVKGARWNWLALGNNRDTSGNALTGTNRVLLNNAYIMSVPPAETAVESQTNIGFSNDPYRVKLGHIPPNYRPHIGSKLDSANQQTLPGGYRLEYDKTWQPRRSGITARGPLEAIA